MPKKVQEPCLVCNPDGARPGEYCPEHAEQLHLLDHQFEALFRLQRSSRGKDHETYTLYSEGSCEPTGRIVVTETDPENLMITILLTREVDLEARVADFYPFGIEKSHGDLLRERIQHDVIHSWYGNARACVDIFHASSQQAVHWDIGPRETMPDDEEGIEPETPRGGSHSVH